MQSKSGLRLISFVLVVCVLLVSMGEITFASRHRYRHNPQAGKRKAAKRIGVGTAIGAAGGALVGGRKGAVVGGAIGAGGGTAYHVHKKRQWRRRHQRY